MKFNESILANCLRLQMADNSVKVSIFQKGKEFGH